LSRRGDNSAGSLDHWKFGISFVSVTANRYWLCRTPGQQAEGPFGLAQIEAMWQSGSITAAAQICAHDSEEWGPVEDEIEFQKSLRPLPAVSRAPTQPQPVYVVERPRKKNWPLRLVCFGALMVILLAVAVGGRMDSQTNGAIDQQISAKRWIKDNLADPQAELMGMSVVHVFQGTRFRVLQIRGRNAFGGPIIAKYFAELNSADQIITAWNVEDFTNLTIRRYGEEGARVLAHQMRGY
jgi:hypothetical protein